MDDWFDPILDADTELFVDPFLVFKEISGFWSTAHQTLIKHFDRAFHMIAEGNLDSGTLAYKKALGILIFSEPRELCLGYTSKGTAGLGGGQVHAKSIAAAIVEAINRGLNHPSHFEELGILNEGIGPDRISDITCTILKSYLVSYTQAIAQRHNIPVSPHRIFAAAFDPQRLRWDTPAVSVPTNPCTNGPLLLVPKRFLQDLPVLNAREWWNFYQAERLRQDVNYEIMGKVDKKTIVELARKNPDAVRRWTEEKEKENPKGYDFHSDPKGVWQWDRASVSFVADHPLRLPVAKTREEFSEVIEKIISNYRLFIEDQGGWSLLWDSGANKEKPERAAQLLFRGLAQSYCRANNISLDPEVNLGRGPVDFKFSEGFARRAHMEIKKLHNGKFWNGLEAQLPSYMRSDEVTDGWFLAIRLNDRSASKSRAAELIGRVRKINEERGINLKHAVVDARPKQSASKLD
ncbi:MAG TPA: hypothetical protein VGD60_05955 [Candidatus Acidoferrales bacterium]